MARINLGATMGCVIGAVVGFVLTGPYVLLPFLLAILLYNHPSVNQQRKAKY